MHRCLQPSVLAALALAACAKALPAPELAAVPPILREHLALGCWQLEVERQDTNRRRPNVLPRRAALTLTADAASPVGQPLYLRATLRDAAGAEHRYFWAPIPGTDSIEVVATGGVEFRLLAAPDRLDGRTNLLCDLALDCRLPYGLAHATRVAATGN